LILETERLVLRSPSEDLLDMICDYYMRNRNFLEPWQPLRDEDFYTRSHQADLLDEEIQYSVWEDNLRFWILPKDEKAIIGQIGLSQIVRGIFLSTYMGYSLDGGYLNRGFMTEAIAAVVDYAFKSMKLHRIEANVMPRNSASLRVLEKLGFRNEGLARKYLKINGVWEDHVHMVLLNDDPDL